MRTLNLLKRGALLLALFCTQFSWAQPTTSPPPPQSTTAMVMSGNNLVTVPDNALFDIASPGGFTFEGWFNICTPNSVIIDKHFCTNTNTQAGYFLMLDANGQVRFHFESTGGCAGAATDFNVTNTTTQSYADNIWHHISLRVGFDPTTGGTNVHVMVDGIDVIGPQVTPLIPFTNTQPMRMGGYVNANNSYFFIPNGRFDDFRFYNSWIPDGQLMQDTPPNVGTWLGFDFETPGAPPTQLTSQGNSGLIGTHNSVPPNVNNTTPTASNPNYSISDITINSNSAFCLGNLITFQAVFGNDTLATDSLLYTWQINDGSSWITLDDTTNSFDVDTLDLGQYTLVVSTPIDSTNCPEVDTLVFTISDCCEQAVQSGVTFVPDQTTIDVPTFWGTTNDKFYVQGQVFVTAELDITNVDVLFEQGAEIIVEDDGFIRANNSVFRPCFLDETWRGISFPGIADNASGTINECTFKNARRALNVRTSNQQHPISITNNLFKNCRFGVVFRSVNHNGNISGNTFEIDEYAHAFNAGTHEGIRMRGSTFTNPISQNHFVNLSTATKDFIGINATNNVTAGFTQNDFTDCMNAVFVNNSTVNIENNEMNLTYEPPFNEAQIHITNGSSSRVTYNEVISTSPYESIFTIVGLRVENETDLVVNANNFEGFATGIWMTNTSDSRLYENTIINSIRTGIITELSSDLSISCNTIDLQYNSGIGIQYINTVSGVNNDEIASNCIFDTQVAILMADGAVSPTPPYTPLPDVKNNYLYNYRFQGLNISDMDGNIGTAADAGRNSFFRNHPAALDITVTPLAIVNAIGNFNMTVQTGLTSFTTNNDFNSTASCANQEDVNNNQTLYMGEACYNPAPFTSVVPIQGGIPKLAKEKVPEFIAEHGLGNQFVPIIELAHFQNVWDLELKNTLLESVDQNKLDELKFYVGLFEQDAAIQSILNTANWNTDFRLHMQGLYELTFNDNLSQTTISKLESRIEDVSCELRNEFVTLLLDDDLERTIPYIIDEPKSPLGHDADVIADLKDENVFEIYPNPAANELNLVYLLDDIIDGQSFSIYDANGRLVMSMPIVNIAEKTVIDISQLEAGVYHIQMIYNESKEPVQQRFVKMN